MQIEVNDSSTRFWFRLIAHDGRKTAMCSYRQVAMLDGKVAATEYYLPASIALTPITPEKFCEMTCVGEEKANRTLGDE